MKLIFFSLRLNWYVFMIPPKASQKGYNVLQSTTWIHGFSEVRTTVQDSQWWEISGTKCNISSYHHLFWFHTPILTRKHQQCSEATKITYWSDTSELLRYVHCLILTVCKLSCLSYVEQADGCVVFYYLS